MSWVAITVMVKGPRYKSNDLARSSRSRCHRNSGLPEVLPVGRQALRPIDHHFHRGAHRFQPALSIASPAWMAQ